MTTSLLLTANLLLAGYMTGLIWFVQVVHYPLFARVGSQGFAGYQLAHERLTTYVVAPPMLAELAVSAWLVVSLTGFSRQLAIAALVLLLINWASTFFIQVPCHQQLEAGFDAQVHAKLVGTNWIRTIAWSGRAVIGVILILQLR